MEQATGNFASAEVTEYIMMDSCIRRSVRVSCTINVVYKLFHHSLSPRSDKSALVKGHLRSVIIRSSDSIPLVVDHKSYTIVSENWFQTDVSPRPYLQRSHRYYLCSCRSFASKNRFVRVQKYVNVTYYKLPLTGMSGHAFSDVN